MASELLVNKITPESGTTLTLGESGDTISFASGVLPSLESLTITGDLTVDTDTFKVDSTNDRVGIGISAPNVTFEVKNTGAGEGDVARFARENAGDQGFLDITIDPDANETIFDSSGSTAQDFVFRTGGTERMRINSSGNVGIGTDSPSANLEISGSGNKRIDVINTSGPTNRLSVTTATAYVGAVTNHTLAFIQNDTERMRIDTSGNVGIGTTSPSGKLNVVGERIVVNSGAIGTNLTLGGRSIEISGVENLSASGRAGFVNRITNDYSVVNDNAGFMHLYPFSDGDNAYAFRASVGTTLSDTFWVKQQGDAYFSGAIHLGGTGSANALDDYEEGTFTITLTGATTAPTTPITATGHYTKIGQVVHIIHSFVNVNTTGASGTLYITGLPFTSRNTSELRNVGTIWGNCIRDAGVDITNHVVSSLTQNSTTISALHMYDLTTVDIHARTAAYLYVNITYFTDS